MIKPSASALSLRLPALDSGDHYLSNSSPKTQNPRLKAKPSRPLNPNLTNDPKPQTVPKRHALPFHQFDARSCFLGLRPPTYGYQGFWFRGQGLGLQVWKSTCQILVEGCDLRSSLASQKPVCRLYFRQRSSHAQMSLWYCFHHSFVSSLADSRREDN